MRRIAFIILLLLMVRTGFTGNTAITFDHISLKEGLSQSSVFCVFQDSRGFMWFGTEEGLNKYDGYEFSVYKHDPRAPNSLSSNIVSAIREDPAGNLWIGTYGGGINKFDRKTHHFVRYRNRPGDPNSLSDDVVFCLYIDRANTLWIGSKSGGLSRFEPKSNRFVHYRQNPADPTGISDNFIRTIYEDSKGMLWVGTDGGWLNCLDRETNTFTRYKNTMQNSPVFAIYEDQAGTLWVGCGDGLKFLDRATGTLRSRLNVVNPTVGKEVSSILEDQRGILWIGTRERGLYSHNRLKNQFTAYTSDPRNPTGLNSNEIMTIYRDQSGIFWIGTYGGGINKFEPEKTRFSHFRKEPGAGQTLSDNDVMEVYEDREGFIWLGTEGGGLNRYDPTTGQFRHYRHSPNNPNSLSDDQVLSIYQDQRGILWIGTYEGGMNKFDPATGTFTRFRAGQDGENRLSSDQVFSIIGDRNGKLWIGTYGGGLNRLDPTDNTFVHYRKDPQKPGSLGSDLIYVVFEDRNGDIWVGTTSDGLALLNRKTNQFTAYRPSVNNPDSLSHNTVLSIYEDKQGVLWIGTTGGLNRFDREKGVFKVYKTREGLPDDVIYAILEDDPGNLWLSTSRGLSKFNPRNEIFRNYHVMDGLQSYEFNIGAAWKTRSGKMYFGGINGFNAFYPSQIRDNLQKPPIVITSFRKLNQKEPNRDISDTGAVTLSHKESFIFFEFAAMDFSDPSRNQYACKLVGFHNDWVHLGTRREINFTGLAPGDYVLLVKGASSNGTWNHEGTSLSLKVTPPIWMTWWFITLAILATVAVVGSIIRYRFESLRAEMKQEQLQKELKLKADFTAMLVHDLRSPLAAIMGYADLLKIAGGKMDIKKIGVTISRSSDRMLRLINEMLDISKFEAGKMKLNKKSTALGFLMKEMMEIMFPLFEKKQLRVDYDFPQLPAIRIDPEKIGQVINNFISNAIKFSPPGGTISLKVERIEIESKIFLQASVTDRGPGVPEEKRKYLFDKYATLHRNLENKGTGLGLAVSRLIVEAHGGSTGYLRDDQDQVFYFRLPMETDQP